jgi:ubiquinone/menaquinone biosynthesis C-methylase UbiE
METEAQARAYAEADFEEPHSRFLRLLRELLPDLAEAGTALDLGCGPGDISLRFARAFPSWTVHGLDGSAAMLNLGREAVVRAGLQDRVSLVQAYLPGGEAPRDRYDLVFSNSLLHHLADPAALWACVRRWASEGTPVFVMDLMRPESREGAERLVDCYADGEPDILRRDLLNSLLAAYRLAEVKTQLVEAGLGHLRQRAASDRHLIVWGRC